MLPFTVSVAMAATPDGASTAEPRVVFPDANVMLPVGQIVPLAARIVAVTFVDPV